MIRQPRRYRVLFLILLAARIPGARLRQTLVGADREGLQSGARRTNRNARHDGGPRQGHARPHQIRQVRQFFFFWGGGRFTSFFGLDQVLLDPVVH